MKTTILTVLVSLFLEAQIFAQSGGVALVLSGGGSRGFAHLGVLKYLEEQQIPIGCITGSSIGAIIGGFYAAGYSTDEIEALLKNTDWLQILDDQSQRKDLPFRLKRDHDRSVFDLELGLKPKGPVLPPALMSAGQKFNVFLETHLLRTHRLKNFDELPIPFRAVATDLETGEAVILSSGSLADALRASSAYPGVIAPIELNGRLLTDGGASNNLPTDVAKKTCGGRVVAVDVGADLSTRDELSDFFDISDQSISILMKRSAEAQKKLADIVIRPEIKNRFLFSNNSFDEVVAAGYRAADLQLRALTQKLVSLKKTKKKPQDSLGVDKSS